MNAGAGSGKTQVIIARIAYLILKHKVSPSSILGLTFTKEAAENMRSRLATRIGKDDAKKVRLSTFHSFAYQIMQTEFPEMYAGKQIAQHWWKLSTASEIISPSDGLGIDLKPGELLGFISYQKSNFVREGDDIIIDDRIGYVKHVPRDVLIEAYDLYKDKSIVASAYDFDDMLMDFYYKLKEVDWLADQIKSRFDYVLVDEFQDTSSINLEILKMITDNNLFAVGDFRQGIYGFINANIDNILDFHTTFPDSELIELRHNFRSTQRIVGIINDVIASSPNEKYKEFQNQVAGNETLGNPIKITGFGTYLDEVNYVCHEIKTLMDSESLTFNDFAIICRTNAELGMYESKLAELGIPVRLSSNTSFFDRNEIADILAYAEHALDKNDDMSLRRIYNTPNRYISKKNMSQLSEYAYSNKLSLEDAISKTHLGYSQKSFDRLVRIFERLREKIDKPADEFLKLIIDMTMYGDHVDIKSSTPSELIMKKESLSRLAEMAERFGNIKSFLAHVQMIKSNTGKEKDAVNITTTHAAKGLEFDTVFVTGATEDNYPHAMSTDKEEERRLLYVALSRAANNLEITFSQINNSNITNPSPFLVDIAKDDLDDIKRDILSGQRQVGFNYR